MAKDALNLINRQKKEIEKLDDEQFYYKIMYHELAIKEECMRNRAIKEFADKICNTNQPTAKYISISKVKKLVEEMTEKMEDGY